MNRVTPIEMFSAAKEKMLEGREPVSKQDWQLIANFFAANIAPGTAIPSMKLLRVIFNMPLSEEEVVYITLFQQSLLN